MAAGLYKSHGTLQELPVTLARQAIPWCDPYPECSIHEMKALSPQHISCDTIFSPRSVRSGSAKDLIEI